MLKVLRTLLVALTLVIVGALPATVLAATTDQGVVRSYGADTTISQGMIVALEKTDTTKVMPLTSDAVTDMFGVAIAANEAPITVAGATGTQVYVATSGQYNVLVSTENGAIHAGDFISISGLNGIGMKALDYQGTVLGRAASDLTADAIIDHQVAVKTTAGTEKVDIGSIPIAIAIATNPTLGQNTGNLPGFLQIASTNIATKPVPASRVYLGIAILGLAAFIAGAVLYSGIRTSIMAIGRNPLAKPLIFRGLLQTVLTGIGIFVLGLLGVYLLLRL